MYEILIQGQSNESYWATFYVCATYYVEKKPLLKIKKKIVHESNFQQIMSKLKIQLNYKGNICATQTFVKKVAKFAFCFFNFWSWRCYETLNSRVEWSKVRNIVLTTARCECLHQPLYDNYT